MSVPLNPAQREGVRYLDGPLLVLAGACSGKTRVIAAKIGHLVERGQDPKRIVAITFTASRRVSSASVPRTISAGPASRCPPTRQPARGRPAAID